MVTTSRSILISVLLCILAVVVGQQTWAADNPGNVIQDATNRALKILRDPALQGPGKRGERHAQLKLIADETFDWEEMARRSLGFNWQKLDRKKQQQFLGLFKGLLENYYLNQIDNFQGTETIAMAGVQESSGQSVVQTVLTTSSHERIPINYYMQKEPAGWRAFDVSIEGVSLVNNYRDRFSRYLVNHTFEQLVDLLKAQQ